MSISVMNNEPVSVWRTIATIVVSSVAGGGVLALSGFAEGFIAFPAFVAVHQAIYPPAIHGKVAMTALTSVVPVLLAALGGLFGTLTIAILTAVRWGSQSPGKDLRQLLKAGCLGTALGVITGLPGGLALGWRLQPTHLGLFVGYFYGTSLCFLLGLIISLIVAARRNRSGRPEASRFPGDRARRYPSVAWRIASASLGAAYFAACAAFLINTESAGEREARARKDSIAKATLTIAGQTTPQFLVTTTDGSTVDSASKRAGPLLVNFFATWCGPCQSELARLEPEIWQRYKARGLHVLVIGVGETNEAASAFRAKRGFSFPIAPDADREVFSRFAKDTIPRNYLIRSDGRIAYQSVGYTETSFDELVDAIKRELAQPR